MAPLPRNRFDHPLSSRFEEMDCIAVFDDVLVPWDRVVIDGGPGSREIVNKLGADVTALLNVQTAARMLSQIEFFCGLAMKLADAIGVTGFLHIQEKLGEMLSTLEVARAVFYGSEAMAQQMPNGVWVPGSAGLRAFHLKTADLQAVRGDRADARGRRVLLRADAGRLGQRGAAPDTSTSTCAGAPASRPRSGCALQAGVGRDGRDVRAAHGAVRLASTPATRSGSPPASTRQYDKAPLLEIVERALGRRDDAPIPISPDNPGSTIPYQPDTRGMAGTYAETSMPAKRDARG